MKPTMEPKTPSLQRWGLRALVVLAWPVVLSRSAQAVIGFCDTLMTARLGEQALTATTAGAMNTTALTVLPMGVVFIIQSFASQLTGKGDRLAARRHGWYGLLLTLAFTVAFAGLLPGLRPLLAQLNYAPQVEHLMGDYIELRFAGIAAVVGVEALGAYYGGLGNTRFHMVASGLMMVSNVALNWALIEGHWGAPALGVQGAATASVISTWLGFAVLLVLFLRRVGDAAPAHAQPLRSRSRLRWAEFVRVLRHGSANGLNWFLEFAAFMVFINLIVADLGTVSTAALLAVIQVNSVAFMPAFGLASAGAILVGQAIGADKKELVKGIARRTLFAAATWQITVGAIYAIAPVPIMSLFAPPDATAALPEIVKIGALLLALSAAWQLFDAVGMTMSEALRAAGDTSYSLFARLLLAWLIFLPGAYVGVHVLGGGEVAAIVAIIVYLAVLSGVLARRFASGAWKRIELTQDTLALD